MSNKESRIPTVWIYPKAYYTFSQWAKLAGSSSGGGYEMCSFGRTIVEDNECVITDAYMTKHEGTSGSFEADDEDLCLLMMKLNSEGIPPDEAFRTWVHSHPGTGSSATYLSGVDEAMIDRFMTGEFLISIVFDSEGKNPFCRIDTKNPRMSIVADLELYIPYLTEEEIKENKDIFKDKSKKKSYVSTSTSKYVASKPKHQTSGRGGNYQTGFQGYGGGYGGGYDEAGWSGYTQRRTDSFAGQASGSGKSSSAVQIDLVDNDDDKKDVSAAALGIDELSVAELREQFAEIFDLDDEDVQDQWLKWIAESDGFEELFDVIETAKEEGVLEKAQEAAASAEGTGLHPDWYDTEKEAVLTTTVEEDGKSHTSYELVTKERESDVVMIDLPEEDADGAGDGDTKAALEADEEDLFEWLKGLEPEERARFIAETEARTAREDSLLATIEEAIVGAEVDDGYEPVARASSTASTFELIDDDDDGVPHANVASSMTIHATNQDLDRLAEEVLSNKHTKQEAVAVAISRHNLSEEEAEAAIGLRVG